MFVHKVRELDVLRLPSVRVKVIAVPFGVHVHGDPMFPRLIGIVGVAHDCNRVRVDVPANNAPLGQRCIMVTMVAV